ncbi:HNH endonuclease family protein, partial [Hafnia paralvei]|uniref:GmrSD restriction endonuclease domain-containing protein n=1 Tax=Hafnia paralvei TaxID=546367 RepID=UPI001FFE4B4D
RDVRKKKIQLISRFIDLILTSRIITKKANTYDNLKDISFLLVKEVRGKNYSELLTYIQGEWGKYYSQLDKLPEMQYENKSRSEMLYILSRIASFLETEMSITNKVGFDIYMQRDRSGKTFDIEHVLRSVIDQENLPSSTLGFTTDAEYNSKRNLIGGLILLPRSRNRSLSDNIYSDKKGVYGGENILCQTLCPGFYQNNPDLTRFQATYTQLNLQEQTEFLASSITARGELYKQVALEIWKPPA